MTEPDEIEFRERVAATDAKPHARSLPIRIGIVAGSAVLVVLGAVAGMGASPSGAPGAANAPDLTIAAPAAGPLETVELTHGLRGGFGRGGLHAITIRAINGSNLSLATEDGWTRTITVGDDTTISKRGETVTVGDLAVGDQIGLAQEREDDGSFTITAIRVVLPTIGGEVTAVTNNTITVTGLDDTTGTIHVDGDTTFELDGTTGQALSDIEVGDFVIAEGALRDDGSLDADVIHGGLHRVRGDGFGPGRGPWDKNADPNATPTPAPATSS